MVEHKALLITEGHLILWRDLRNQVSLFVLPIPTLLTPYKGITKGAVP